MPRRLSLKVSTLSAPSIPFKVPNMCKQAWLVLYARLRAMPGNEVNDCPICVPIKSEYFTLPNIFEDGPKIMVYFLLVWLAFMCHRLNPLLPSIERNCCVARIIKDGLN